MDGIEEKYVFFGAGKIGQRALECFELVGLRPVCFVDNKAMGEINGIPIVRLDNLSKEENYIVCLASKAVDEMREQLLRNGYNKNDILDFSSIPKVLSFINKRFLFEPTTELLTKRNRRLLVDLQNGITLGGVESWVKGMLSIWCELGWDVRIALPQNKVRDNVLNFTAENLFFISEDEVIKETIKVIRQEKIHIAVCNFCGRNGG